MTNEPLPYHLVGHPAESVCQRRYGVLSGEHFSGAGVFAFFFMAMLSIEPVCAMQDEEGAQKQDRTKAVAVAMWAGMAILAVFFLGVGLMWGVSRARRLLKRREPVHTEMPDIWFLNPPEKGKPDKP